MSQEITELKDKLIEGLKEQVESYKRLSTVNDAIIDKQREYITKLEEVVGQYRELFNESLTLLKENV